MALPLAIQAQVKAQLPYSMVSSYLELFKSLENLDLIFPSMMITSTDRTVAPQTIEFKIKFSNDWLTFNPDENGVIEFPDEPDWEGLNFLSNQPKGTLQLVIGFSANPLSSTSMSYQELMALVKQFDEALAALWPQPRTIWMQIGVINPRAAAKARATVSVPPPAPQGQIRVMGRSGKPAIALEIPKKTATKTTTAASKPLLPISNLNLL